jgi:hypothetical protein
MIVPFDRANEAHFLSAALNSAVSRYMVATLAIGTQISTYVLENIRVPKFDTGDETHTGLAKLSAQAHEATAKGDAERVAKIEEQVDLLAAKLWGLSYKELKEIKLALEELR